MDNELVGPVVNNYPDICITPYGEREKLLCEAMFWAAPPSSFPPMGIGNLDTFLKSLTERIYELWIKYDRQKERINELENTINELQERCKNDGHR